MRVAFIVLILFLGPSCSEVPPSAETTNSSVEQPRNDRQAIPSLAPDGYTSAAVLAGETLYLSGQSDADSVTGDRPGETDARTRQAMDNVGAVLAAAGMDHSHLVSCRLQLADMDDYQAVNSAYASYFSEAQYPARTTVEVVALADEASINITCIGYRDVAGTKVVRPPADEIPPAMGPYSPAVMAGNTLYLSGQGGRDPLTDEISDRASDQTDRTLETIRTTLRAAGLGLENVVSAYSFHSHPSDAQAIESRLSAAFPSGMAPIRARVPVGRLPGDIAVEITFVAAQGRYSITRLHPVGQAPDAGSSPAVLARETLYLEALAMPESGASLVEQFRAIMTRHESSLSLADMDLSNVVYADLFLSDLAEESSLDALLREYFPATPPAATVIGVGTEAGAKIMVGLIAAR